MSKTYIFAVGGTGARVMRALTMVLASGADNLKSDTEFVPMIYDYDLQNGDKNRTVRLMDCYKTIHNKVHDGVALQGERSIGTFFSAKISEIKNQTGQNAAATRNEISTDSGFAVDMAKCVKKANTHGQQEQYMSLGDYINYGQFGRNNGANTNITKTLIDSLYDESSELNMTIDKGFKGRPNVGCVVIDKIEELAEFKHFKIVFNASDRIVIVGSVFGGTGATCIPSLLRMLRNNPNTQNAKIAVIAALPYFKVAENSESSIDSNTFSAKTKAAIATYRDMVYPYVNAIYFLGDRYANNSFDNKEGDKEQKNAAALCELEGALDILHFVGLSDNALESRGVPYEIGYKSNNNEMPGEVSYTHFMGDATNANNVLSYIDALNRLVLFSKFNTIVLKDDPSLCSNKSWYKDKLDQTDVHVTSFKESLYDFADELFDWIEELQGEVTPRRMKLFNAKLKTATDFTIFLGEPHAQLVRKKMFVLKEYPSAYNIDFEDKNAAIDMLLEEYGAAKSSTGRYHATGDNTVKIQYVPALYIELSSIVWKNVYQAIKDFVNQ